MARLIRDDILEGRRSPGTRLGQQEIANSLGVSRVPVREALRLLEAGGYVSLHPYAGARVARLDYRDCVEIYRIRERLEPLAFVESMVRLTSEQREAAESASLDVERLQGDTAAWLQADRKFHFACYAGLDSPRLSTLVNGYWSSTQMYRRILLDTFTEADYETAHLEHRLMLVAMREQNHRAGEELLRFALERSRVRLTANGHLFDG